jgi:flagellar capping protein FliD
VQHLFIFSGASTNQGVTFSGGGSKTVAGPVDFAITRDGNGVLWGTLTRNNVTSAPIEVSNGTLIGTGDFEGLKLTVTDTGSGTLTLTRGAGQAVVDLLSKFTGVGGDITSILKNVTDQNKNLAKQITSGKSMLDREREVLKNKFAKMEAVVGQMKASAGSLSGM